MLYMCIHIVDSLDQFWATYEFIFLQLSDFLITLLMNIIRVMLKVENAETRQAGHVHQWTLMLSVMTKHFSSNTNFIMKIGNASWKTYTKLAAEKGV